MTSRWRLLLIPSLFLWLAGVLTPLVFVIRTSLYAHGAGIGERRFDTLFYQPGTWSLQSFSTVLTSPFHQRLFAFTGLLALLITVLTLVCGYLLGYLVYRASPRGKVVLLLLIALPKFTNTLVFVFGVKLIFGANGLLPVVAAEVLLLVPYAALTIAATLETVPYSLVEAARGLGASAAAAFWRVTFPLSLPGLIAAAILTVLWSASAFLGPYLLGEPAQYTVAVEVERHIRHDLNWPLAAALNLVLIALLTAGAYSLSLLRRRLG